MRITVFMFHSDTNASQFKEILRESDEEYELQDDDWKFKVFNCPEWLYEEAEDLNAEKEERDA